MLFVAFPDSISSFRLTVMVLPMRGGSSGEGGLAAAFSDAVEAGPGKTLLRAEDMFEAEPVPDEDSVGAAPVWMDSFGAVAGPGSSGPIAGGSDESAGGSDESAEGSCEGRVTITVSPASLAIPPASARTSRMVTGRSAWYTMACCTAPTTVMGLLLLSFTLTLTWGRDTRPL